jgi:hypothetical protein
MAGEAMRVGEGTFVAEDIYEYAIPAFRVQPIDRLRENTLVVQVPSPWLNLRAL